MENLRDIKESSKVELGGVYKVYMYIVKIQAFVLKLGWNKPVVSISQMSNIE